RTESPSSTAWSGHGSTSPTSSPPAVRTAASNASTRSRTRPWSRAAASASSPADRVQIPPGDGGTEPWSLARGDGLPDRIVDRLGDDESVSHEVAVGAVVDLRVLAAGAPLQHPDRREVALEVAGASAVE